MLDWIFSPAGWLQFGTLLLLEIILGIDNIIFLAIVVQRLPKALQSKARYIGLFLALFARLALLASIFWLSKLTAPLFSVLGNEISGRDLVLLLGGGFLVVKSIKELLADIACEAETHDEPKKSSGFFMVILQIILIDLIFSLDSVITAVGIADELGIMAAAVVIAILLMMAASGAIARLIERFSELKTIALAFLVLVGAVLMAEGLEWHIDRGYIYAPLGFSLLIALLNIAKARARQAAKRSQE